MVEINLTASAGSTEVTVKQGVNLKSGDTLPTFKAELIDADGSAFDLTGMDVKFYVGQDGLISGESMTVVDETSGEVEYQWQETDTDGSGEYDAEIVVTNGSGGERTFPTSGFVTITINDDLQ
jgi:hypothetical protein